MEHATQVALIERVLECVRNKTTHMEGGSFRQQISHYITAAELAREEEMIFRRYPIIVAHSSELPNPGDYLTHSESGVPIVLLRDQAGMLQAFLNVCRHRGTQLVQDRCGHDNVHLSVLIMAGATINRAH